MVESVKEKNATNNTTEYRTIRAITGVKVDIPNPKKNKQFRFVPGGTKFNEHWKWGKPLAGTKVLLNQHFYVAERWLGRETVCTAVIKEKIIKNKDGSVRIFSLVDYIHTPHAKASCFCTLKKEKDIKGKKFYQYQYRIKNTDVELSFYQILNGHSHNRTSTSAISTTTNNFEHLDAIQALKDDWQVVKSDGRQLILKKDGITITRHLPKKIPSVQMAISMIASGKI
jgi:hypothetical protein